MRLNMKFLRKINKGLILTIIVLIVLIVYLINVEAKRNSEKPNIEIAVKEYINLINKYAVMPEEYQKVYGYSLIVDEKKQNEIDNAKEEQLKKFENELKQYSINNENVLNIQIEMLRRLIDNKNDFINNVITKYDKKITKINKYAFDDDQVIVSFNSEVETEVKYLEGMEEKAKLDEQECNNESITLKFVDGKWQIVYADLTIFNGNNYINYMF